MKRLRLRITKSVSSLGYVLRQITLKGTDVYRCRSSYRGSIMETGYSSFVFRASRGRVFSTCFDTSIDTVERVSMESLKSQNTSLHDFVLATAHPGIGT
jgi:hypothetical protein